jgi:hypothetical protein
MGRHLAFGVDPRFKSTRPWTTATRWSSPSGL